LDNTGSKQAIKDVQEPLRQTGRLKGGRRRKNLEKELQSARKNSESNIVNQLFGYLSQI
jgi:hypothetical protein